MAIFNSYVKLPEGIPQFQQFHATALIPLGIEEHGVPTVQPAMFLSTLTAVTTRLQSGEAIHHAA